MHLWVRLPDDIDDVALASRADANGVNISPGRIWFAADAPGSFLRLTYAGATPAELTDAVQRLAARLA